MNWFKRLIAKKKSLEEAKNWLDEEKAGKQEEHDKAVSAAAKEMPKLLEEAEERIKKIEQAGLRNPNIPERAKHYLQGNRERLTELSRKFMENLFVPKNSVETSQIELLFYQYAQNSARSAAITSEFLGEEVKEMHSALARIETKIREIKKHQDEIEKLQKTRNMFSRLEEIQSEKEKTEKQKTELNEKLGQEEKKLESIKKEKEELTKKEEYVKIKEEILAAATERREAEQAITGLFNSLSDLIKKYAHKIKNQKMAMYAEQPLIALSKDYSFTIIRHAEGIKDALEKGEVELKPEKAQKAMEALQHLTKKKLSAMIHRHATAKKHETDVHNEIARSRIINEYEQHAMEIKKSIDEIQALKNMISRLASPSEEETMNKLKEELEQHNILLL